MLLVKISAKTPSYLPLRRLEQNHLAKQLRRKMATSALFKYIEPGSYDPKATEPFKKPWSKVDVSAYSYGLTERRRTVNSLRGHQSEFSLDNAGFAVFKAPANEKLFLDKTQVTTGYYSEVEELLRQRLPGVKKVVIFDYTIRRRLPGSPREPVQLVHVDQTPRAAEIRVRRHVPPEEAEELLKGRYQIVNVWRPIEYPASDHPLGMIDWRTTDPSDFVKTDLLYPVNHAQIGDVAPDPSSLQSTEGYEVKGETYNVAPNEKHHFYYVKDMEPDEVILLKCFDSSSHTMTNGRTSIAHGTPHTAFSDPQTPPDAPGRQSIEVRCLVFYE